MKSSRESTPVGEITLGTGRAFAAVLQDCVFTGLFLVDSQQAAEPLNPEAAQFLKIHLNRQGAGLGRLPTALQEAVAEARGKGSSVERNVILLESSRTPVAVRVSAVPITTKGATVLLAVNRFGPISPLEPALERLDRLASIGTVSAGMAHEVKNALVAVKTFVDLLLEKNPDAELAPMVRTEMSRIDSILGRLLRFARPAPPVRMRVSLHETLEYALRLIQPQFSPKSLTVQRCFKASCDRVLGDQSQLQQVFVNLFLNACEAMGSAGILRVTTITEQENGQTGRVRVVIADTGPGISHENLKRVFEPFFTTKTDGTGLGLAVTRRIILDHGGGITVDSEEGKGAVFTVSLPLHEGA